MTIKRSTKTLFIKNNFNINTPISDKMTDSAKKDALKETKVDMATFDWATLETELRTNKAGKNYMESNQERFKRKMWENPLVPIGAGLTTVVLIIGIGGFATKRTQLSQRMMRWRILAQGFTVAGLIGGVLFNLKKNQNKLKTDQSNT